MGRKKDITAMSVSEIEELIKQEQKEQARRKAYIENLILTKEKIDNHTKILIGATVLAFIKKTNSPLITTIIESAEDLGISIRKQDKDAMFEVEKQLIIEETVVSTPTTPIQQQTQQKTPELNKIKNNINVTAIVKKIEKEQDEQKNIQIKQQNKQTTQITPPKTEKIEETPEYCIYCHEKGDQGLIIAGKCKLCEKTAPKCPTCGHGIMVIKNSKKQCSVCRK